MFKHLTELGILFVSLYHPWLTEIPVCVGSQELMQLLTLETFSKLLQDVNRFLGSVWTPMLIEVQQRCDQSTIAIGGYDL